MFSVHDGGRWKWPEILSANDGYLEMHTQGEEYQSKGNNGIQAEHGRHATRNEPATQRKTVYDPTHECQETDLMEGVGECTDAWGWGTEKGRQ